MSRREPRDEGQRKRMKSQGLGYIATESQECSGTCKLEIRWEEEGGANWRIMQIIHAPSSQRVGGSEQEATQEYIG